MGMLQVGDIIRVKGKSGKCIVSEIFENEKEIEFITEKNCTEKTAIGDITLIERRLVSEHLSFEQEAIQLLKECFDASAMLPGQTYEHQGVHATTELLCGKLSLFLRKVNFGMKPY